MILVLLGAAGVSLAASGGEDWLDAVIILVIVVVNGIISISQEDRAQQALEELRKLSSPQAAVLRGGKVTKIPAAQLVPGDVILLEAGGPGPRRRSDSGVQPPPGGRVPHDRGVGAGGRRPPSESLPADAPLGGLDQYGHLGHPHHRWPGDRPGVRHRDGHPDGPYRRAVFWTVRGRTPPSSGRMGEIRKLCPSCACAYAR